jgi:copper transport protein
MFPLKNTYGHAFVTSSNPSPSQSVSTSPTKVDVFFSEPVDLRYSKLKVIDQNGKQVDNKDIHHLNGDQSSLSVSLPQLNDGVYTVSTTVLSQTDGHVTDNAFVFATGEAAIPANISTASSQKSVIYIPEAISRFPTLVGQVVIVGCAFSTLWLWKPVNKIQGISSLIFEARRAIDKRLISVFLIASIILLVSDIAILTFQAIAISASILDVIATRFGMVLAARTILSLALLAISVLEFRTYRKASQILPKGEIVGILALGLSLLLTTSMIGHGAANNQFSSIGIDFVHNLAASLWIGGVIYLGFVFTSKLRDDTSLGKDHKVALLSLIIPRFSLIVVTILGFIVFTGPLLLLILDSNLGQVLSSLYGKTLLVKLALAVVMLAIGSYNQLSIQRDAQARSSIAISVSANGKSRDFDDPPNAEPAPGANKKGKKKNEYGDIFSRFSRTTKAESIVGILLLASVAFLVNTGVPASEVRNQSAGQPFSNMMFQQVQDGFRSTYFIDNNTKILLSIVPFTIGSNNFTVEFVDSQNKPLDVNSATLQYTETQQSIGPIRIDLHKVSKGIYSAKGAFGIPGLWNLQIEGVPNKPNSPAISATFTDIRIKPRLDQLQFNITEFNTPSNSSQPLYPIYDKSRNSIWVGDTAIDSGQILEFDLAAKKYHQHKINGSNIITILAQDSKNKIWFVDPIKKLLGSYEPVNGKYQLFSLPNDSLPSSIAIDPSDRIWICSSTTGQIFIFDPKTSTIAKILSLDEGTRPLTIAIDSISGLAWIADEIGKLIMVDPINNYSSTIYMPAGVNDTLKSPTALLLDNTGDTIFISQHEGHKVSSFNRITKLFQDYPTLDPNGLPFGLAPDKYGNIWVAEHTINKIAVIDPQTGKSKEVKIPNQTPFVQWPTTDSEGNIWFAEQRGHALGMVTTKANAAPLPPAAPQAPPEQNEGISTLITYNLVVAPAIVVALILVAFVYVKNVVDCRVAERILKNYKLPDRQ